MFKQLQTLYKESSSVIKKCEKAKRDNEIYKRGKKNMASKMLKINRIPILYTFEAISEVVTVSSITDMSEMATTSEIC